MDFDRFWDAPDHQILALLISIALVAMGIELIIHPKAYDVGDTVVTL